MKAAGGNTRPSLPASPAPGSWVRGLTGAMAVRRVSGVVLAIASIVVAWYLVSLAAHDLPKPGEVVSAVWSIGSEASSYVDIVDTLRRVAIGFVASTLLGLVIGVAMGQSPWWRGLVKPWVLGALSIPGPIVIIFATLIIGVSETSVLVALVVSVTPYAVNIVAGAVGGRDVALEQMSEVFRLGVRRRLRHVLLPQLLPAMFASMRTSFAMSWKLVVVIEAIGASRGIGAQISHSFRVLDVASGIAWAAIFVVVMWLVDVFGFDRAQQFLFRWRTAAERG